MEIWRMSTAGGAPVQIAASGGAHMPAESPDGVKVFYHRYQDPGSIWSIPVQGGTPMEIVGSTQRSPVGFTVASKGIYYGAPPHAGEQPSFGF
jgi:hypothetical protein